MARKIIPDDDPEKSGDQPQNSQTNDEPADSSDQPANPAFDLSDDEDLDAIRKAMLDSEDYSDESPEQAIIDEGEVDQNSDTKDDFSSRINAMSFDDESDSKGFSSVTPPFVMDDLPDFSEEGSESGYRTGWAQPETLRLLLNDSITDAEVIEISRELGIDWERTPGDTREEKIDYLINFFKPVEDDEPSEGVPAFGRSQLQTKNVKQDWGESDNRLQALQASLDIPESPERKSRTPFFLRFKEDFDQSSSLIKGLTIALGVLAVLMIVAISFIYFSSLRAAPAPVTPTNPDLPYPQAIQLPGGWVFELKIGAVQDGNWQPTSAEWLQGTEVCRLVSLPWSEQLDAVFPTIKTGDELFLTMSNKDLLGYTVESTRSIQLDELSQLVTRDSPCLVVVLTRKDTDIRQVIISTPGYSTKAGNAIVTVTTNPSALDVSTQTPQP